MEYCEEGKKILKEWIELYNKTLDLKLLFGEQEFDRHAKNCKLCNVARRAKFIKYRKEVKRKSQL